MTAEDKKYFSELNKIDVSDKIEKKNGLSYLSWAYAWGELKKRYPDSTYTIYENAQGWNYHTDGRTAWVKTGVTVLGVEHVEYLPVMDYRNNSIPLEKITSFDVNKAIQRSLTKAVARHGLGLYIYAGEDLPEEETKSKPTTKAKAAPSPTASTDPVADARAAYQELIVYCKENNHDIKEVAKAYSLNSKSTAEEFKTALRRLVYFDTEKKKTDLPEEV
jgi:hypothetical protein